MRGHLQAPRFQAPHLEPLPHPPFPCKKHPPPAGFQVQPQRQPLWSVTLKPPHGDGVRERQCSPRGPLVRGRQCRWQGRASPAARGRQNSLHRSGRDTMSPSHPKRQVRSTCAGFSLDQKPLPVSSLEKATQSRSDCPVNQHAHTAGPATRLPEGQHILGKTNMAVE